MLWRMDKQQLTAGNAASWAVGATLGVLLGVTLLIATPRMMFAPSTTTEQTPTAAAATSDASGATEGATTPSEAENPESASAEAPTEEAATEEAPAAEETTVAASTGNAEAGKDVYATCAGCHGAEGQGAVGPALNAAAQWSDAEFATAIREGQTPEKQLSPVMPRFTEAQVNNQQLADVHAYIKTLY